MADTPAGETVTPGDSQTTVPTPAAPVANAGDTAEVERLRKELEQKDLRTRQLENEAAARIKADEEAQTKRLEEQNEYKSLFEQEKAKADAFRVEREQAVAQIELDKSQAEIYKEFPTDVVELAADAGLNLSEDTEEAKTKLRSTLTKLAAKVSAGSGTRPNNGATPPASNASREELISEFAKSGDQKAFDKAVSGLNWVAIAKAQNGFDQ